MESIVYITNENAVQLVGISLPRLRQIMDGVRTTPGEQRRLDALYGAGRGMGRLAGSGLCITGEADQVERAVRMTMELLPLVEAMRVVVHRDTPSDATQH